MNLKLALAVRGTFLVGLASFSILAAAQVDPARVVAVVNGEEIKGSEYYRRMEYLPGIGRRVGNQFVEFPPGFFAVEQLITERLVFQLAQSKGISISDAEVDSELATRTTENANYLKDWIGGGRTAEELSYQVRYELAQFKISTFGITITDQEIETDYKANPSTYTVPRQYKLHVIVVKDPADKASSDADLAGGKTFEQVASARSVDISRVRGGDYGQVPADGLSPRVKAALALIRIGQQTDWIDVGDTDQNRVFLRFRLDDVVPEEKLALDGKLKRMIRKKLMMIRGAAKNDITKDMNALRLKAKIEIKQAEFAEAYKRFIDSGSKTGG